MKKETIDTNSLAHTKWNCMAGRPIKDALVRSQ